MTALQSSTTAEMIPHLLLIGSTGKTGRLVISEALDRGHTITALAREPRSLDIMIASLPISQRDHTNIVKADPTSETDVRSALEAAVSHASSKPIVIVSTLGQTRKSGNPWSTVTSPPLFMTHAVEALLAALGTLPKISKTHFRKLVVMSMFGVGESFTNLHILIKPVMRYSNMWQTIEDHSSVSAVIKGQSDIDYVMVRPSMLKEGDKKAVRVLGEDGTGNSWVIPSSITSNSVVSFLLDVCTSSEWNGKTPVIVN